MNEQLSDRACDWAYARLVNKARNGDKHQTRELATHFRVEVLDDCYIRALVDIDERRGDMKAHIIVRDVCKEFLS